jgi:alpha/beta superfamily hydrolase
MSDTCHEHAFGLPTTDGLLAAMLHVPAAPVRALLMVAPLVEERKACQRLTCELARRLTADGTVVLRFDLRGCGDSPGAFESFSLPDWQTDIAAAAAWLRARHPHLPQFMLGIRFGAQLVLQSEAPRDGLILVEPVAGPEFLRQLQQRSLVNQMIAFGAAPLGRAAMAAAWQAGTTVDLDGFPVSARLWTDLQATRTGRAPTPPAAALIVSTGTDTKAADTCHTLLPAAERIALHLPAFWNTVGHIDLSALQQAVQTWVGAQAAGRATPAADPADAPAGAPVGETERLVSFTSRLGRVRGVLHVPGTPATARPARRLLFLAGWSGDRTGPHRMFVQAARQLAADGHACLRIDYGGRGDSDGAVADATIASMTADAQAAMDWLRATVPDGGPLTLVAICSGCKVAITTATTAPDVAELVLWSAESMGSLRASATNRRKTAHALQAYARKLLRPETWRKLLRGQVRTDMVRKALVQHETRSAEEARQEDGVLRSFRAYAGRILFTFGGSDPDAPGSSAAYQAFCARYGIAHTCHTVPHAGHSYYGAEWQRDVIEATARFLSPAGAAASQSTHATRKDSHER